jgi:hypothetical protein
MVNYFQPEVRFGSWLRENAGTEFANGNFVSTSINLKNKSAGDGCRAKTIEKTILRAFRARTFSHSLGGQKQTSISEGSMSALPLKTDIHRHDGDVRFVPTGDSLHRSKRYCCRPDTSGPELAARHGKKQTSRKYEE